MNRIIKVFMNIRRLLKKMRIGFLLFTFCMLGMQVHSQKSESKIAKLNQKNKVERLLNYSESDIDALCEADDLRILGKVFLNNHYFEQAEICYQELLAKFDTSTLAEDYMNYYFCLLNLGKQDVILKSNNHKFDLDQWVSLLKSAAHISSYFLNKETVDFSPLNSHISSLNGFTVTNDTIHYFSKQLARKAILDETNEILTHRFGKVEERFALLLNDSITEVMGLERTLNSKPLRYIARQVFVLQNSNDTFYSVESVKSGRLSIHTTGDRMTLFPFNSDEFDCSMPFFDEESNTLYFCSNMPGGYGDLDIYSSMLKDGTWLQPVNLGDKINTPFTEIFPAITSSGLLFSSSGRAGMGKFDNYLYLSEDQVSYNLYPFNSSGSDYGVQEVKNTSIGFKNENLVNYNSSILSVLLRIKNEENNLMASLHPEKLEEVKRIFLTKADSIKKINDDFKIEYKKIEKIEIENTIRDSQIYFKSSESRIEASQFSTLDSVFKSISSLQAKQVFVLGFTDVSGTNAFNNALAYQRSISVINYLKAKGVTSDMVNFTPVAIGENLGQSKMINPKERKVSFRIANKAPDGIGIVAVNQRNKEGVVQILRFNTVDINLPKSEKLKYFSVTHLHLVLPGETLNDLSLKYHCSVECIKQLNSRNTNMIVEGECLFILDDTELNHIIK